MLHRQASLLAWSLSAIAALLAGADIALWFGSGYFDSLSAGPIVKAAFFLIPALALPATGSLIAARRPRNPIGWLVLGHGLVGGIVNFGYFYGLYPTGASIGHVLPAQYAAGHLAVALEAAPWLVLPFVPMLFPDGHLPSARWRPVAWLAGLAGLFPVAITAATPNAAYGPDEPTVATVARHYGHGEGSWLGELIHWSWQLFFLIAIVAGLALIVRMRRARGDWRQQLKWAAVGTTLFAIINLAAPYLIPALLHGPDLHRFLYDFWYPFLFPVGLAVVPALFAIGIFKYRLYDIDVVVNKALVYGALAALVSVVYVGAVVGIGRAVGAGSSNLALSILATVLVATGFQPARQRVQRLADRLVYGRRAAPYDVLAALARTMSEALWVEEVLPAMARTIAEGIRTERAEVRVFLPHGRQRVVAWPEGSTSESVDRTIVVRHRGDAVGEISVRKPVGERLMPAENKLLDDLATQAGPALRNVGLLVELEERLGEISFQAEQLAASRGRIVAAQDAERRKLEQDLHDGAQQQLVSLAGKLRVLKRMMTGDGAPDSARAGALVEELTEEADDALESIRDLGRGIFPQILADKGLAAALTARVAKHGPRAQVWCDREVAAPRFDPHVEAAVYFCCLEALQNAGKHATGARIDVHLSYTRGVLAFSVADRGGGFDVAALPVGSGLQNMRDRMAAVGGTVEVRSETGLGTTVRGSVPIEVSNPTSQWQEASEQPNTRS